MRAYYKGYKRQGKAKVHLIRDKPVRRHYRGPVYGGIRDFPQAWCGVAATSFDNSPVVDVDPSKPLEYGLTWCGPCVGRAAEHADLLTQVVALLVKPP